MATATTTRKDASSSEATGALITASHVTKTFPVPEGTGVFTALDDVSVEVHAGEVVALLGRSGSGKSTLLRILAGLIPASGGEVVSGGKRVRGPNPDVAMVFQSFALLPWLTVQGNVEVGLTARGVGRAERAERANAAIDLVGLDGFESAYPKELSGGMRQRVGFARAFVVRPRVLFMDEPFSALDVLTAENLRNEIDDLWRAGTFPARSILIVTHNIEEAATLADRVIILGANPGRVRGEVRIDLPRPRDRHAPRFTALVEHMYAAMTHPDIAVGTPATGLTGALSGTTASQHRFAALPHVRAGGISGLLEVLVDRDGSDDIADLTRALRLDVDDLLPILNAAAMLGFARTGDGAVAVTESGHAFADADVLRSKDLFRQQVLAHVPLVETIYHTLQQKGDGSMRDTFFLDILDEYYPDAEAERQFATAVDWGRYAELFEFDADDGRLRLS